MKRYRGGKLGYWVVLLTGATAVIGAQERYEVKTVDGIPHALNPARPTKGTVNLEVERTRTINPYEHPDVALRMVRFSRADSGNVVLFDPNRAEGHRFGSDGAYLGLLTKIGQGPGEFSPMTGYYAYFFAGNIHVFGGQKWALFDSKGKFLREKALKNRFYQGASENRFLSKGIDWTDRKNPITTFQLIEFSASGEKTATELIRVDQNLGGIQNPNGQGGFGESWATPNFFYAADPQRQRVYFGLNTEYTIREKDFSGKDVLIIRKPHENVKVRRADVPTILLPWAEKNESSKWMLSAYPDRFIAIKEIAPLPNGHLAVYRVTGPKRCEIDIFSPAGEYLYALVPPSGVEMVGASFFPGGFATIERDEDYFVYREYRIKSLPEVFAK